MANTKVTGDLIASSTIATGNIADNAVTSDKISGITTAHITEGSNLYYTDARADARITAATTSDLSEGTNLYYTDARARSAVSVSGNALSYNSSTGVITSNFEESPTFTGDVTLSAAGSTGEIIQTTDNTEPYLALQRNSGSNGVGVLRLLDGGDLTFDTGTTGAGQTTRLTIDGATGNSTFAGGITATYGNYSSGINADYFRTLAGNSNYNLLTRDNTGNTLFVQAAQSNASQPIAKFSYGSATVNAGTAVLQVSKDNSHFTNCDVGIGTTSPGANLEIKTLTGGAGVNTLRLNTNFGGGNAVDINPFITGINNGGMEIKLAGSQKLVMLPNGEVGIGTSSPDSLLTVSGSSLQNSNTAGIELSNSHNAQTVLLIENTTSRKYEVAVGGSANSIGNGSFYIYDGTAGAARLVIDSIGRMGFNSNIETDTRHYFYSNNNTGAATGVARNIKIKSTQYAGTHVQFVGSQGNGGTIGYSNLTASYNTTGSDERLKKNITNWNENILDKFKYIKPKEFHFNQQKDSEEKQKGYIAQNEVDKFPEAYPLLYDDVSKEDRHQFNPSGMVVYLMKAIQELKAEIDELKTQINN